MADPSRSLREDGGRVPVRRDGAPRGGQAVNDPAAVWRGDGRCPPYGWVGRVRLLHDREAPHAPRVASDELHDVDAAGRPLSKVVAVIPRRCARPRQVIPLVPATKIHPAHANMDGGSIPQDGLTYEGASVNVDVCRQPLACTGVRIVTPGRPVRPVPRVYLTCKSSK